MPSWPHAGYTNSPIRLRCLSGPTAETKVMRIALYEPDIPQNTGTILRLAACLGVEAHIIEPAGFPTTDRAFRRAGMDYLAAATIVRHADWSAFEAWRNTSGARLVLFTTRASTSYLDHAYRPGDILLFGRESAGVPDRVHAAADSRLIVPIRSEMRSLNVAVTAAMALGEALRQLDAFPRLTAGENDHVAKAGG
jgi:tRNA (cytidine/uridine-2'-O-)-methyltransferase